MAIDLLSLTCFSQLASVPALVTPALHAVPRLQQLLCGRHAYGIARDMQALDLWIPESVLYVKYIL
jgi:hypothetical protein